VLGTGTGVGKTWVSCALTSHLRRDGTRVAARKPVQSYDTHEADATDAHLLGAASGETPDRVTPRHRWYPVPMAPPMAADVLGAPRFSVADLAGELDARWDGEADVGVVETAGGACSPIADDGDSIAFAAAVRPAQVVVVADAGLGTIHAVRTTMHVLRGAAIVVLNRFEPADALHTRNLVWLRDRDGFDVITDVTDLAARVAARR